LQRSKIFHTGQISDFFERYINHCNLFQFTNRQNIIRCCIKIFFHISSECFIREVGCINGNTNFKWYGYFTCVGTLSCNRHFCGTDFYIICIRNGIIGILLQDPRTIFHGHIWDYFRTSMTLNGNCLYHTFC